MAGIDGGGGAPAARQPELTPMERVEMKLITCGVREEQLQQQHQEGLLVYLEEHKDKIFEVTAAILSAGTDLSEASKSTKKDKDSSSSDSGYCNLVKQRLKT